MNISHKKGTAFTMLVKIFSPEVHFLSSCGLLGPIANPALSLFYVKNVYNCQNKSGNGRKYRGQMMSKSRLVFLLHTCGDTLNYFRYFHLTMQTVPTHSGQNKETNTYKQSHGILLLFCNHEL